MSQIKTRSIVIKTQNWSDSSKIVTLFTREHGIIDIIAKGARRAKSQYAGKLEVINHVETIIYYSPNRELQNIGEITLIYDFIHFKSDYVKLSIALAIIEMIQKLCKQSENDEVFFDFILSILMSLEQSKNPIIIFWYFTLKFCSYLGFKPDFKNCYLCNKRIDEKAEFFNTVGAFRCKDCSAEFEEPGIKIGIDEINFLVNLQDTYYKDIIKVELNNDINFPLTKFLIDYISYHTEGSLKLKSFTYFNIRI